MAVLFWISFYSSYLYIDKTRNSEYNKGKKVETYETYFLHTHTHTHTPSQVLNEKKEERSFTLIELLIVVAIIGILAALIVVSLTTALSKARDARRVADVNELVKAFNEYYLNNGNYPYYNTTNWTDSCASAWTSVIGADLQSYINPMPIDPLNCQSFGSASWRFDYNSNLESVLPTQTCQNLFSSAQACLSFYFETSNQSTAQKECSGELVTFNSKWYCIIPLE